jgi:hypothetical protein
MQSPAQADIKLMRVASTILLTVAITVLAPNVGSAAPPQGVSALTTIHAEGPATDRGIGVVHLNELFTQVTEALGNGRKLTSGSEEQAGYAEYRFVSGPISINVGFGPEHEAFVGPPVEVDSISTSSPTAVLLGHKLSRGLALFKPLLRRRHWNVSHCGGELFTSLLPGGPGTGIAWKSGRLTKAVIDTGASWGQQCTS